MNKYIDAELENLPVEQKQKIAEAALKVTSL